MDIVFHYPPELFQLLVDTIPLVCRSKKDVLLFFKGAGVDQPIISDLWRTVERDRHSTNKYEIVRTVLTRLNERGEASLGERREILKRVVEFEDFSTCWPDDQLKARGLVGETRRVINVKDSFTRMKQEREQERQQHRQAYEARVREEQKRRASLAEIKDRFYSIFAEQDPQTRGRQLEKLLNDYFVASGIAVRESFRRTDETGSNVLEQIDGVIEFDGELYLVEVKWLKSSVGVDDVSRHLVRVYHRGSSRGIFMSATEFSEGSLEICREALQRTVVTLCTLDEIVRLLEREGDLRVLLKDKVHAAVVDKNPYKKIVA